jgi:hypothetical protein
MNLRQSAIVPEYYEQVAVGEIHPVPLVKHPFEKRSQSGSEFAVLFKSHDLSMQVVG